MTALPHQLPQLARANGVKLPIRMWPEIIDAIAAHARGAVEKAA